MNSIFKESTIGLKTDHSQKATKQLALMVGISSRKLYLYYSLTYRMLQSDSSLTTILPKIRK